MNSSSAGPAVAIFASWRVFSSADRSSSSSAVRPALGQQATARRTAIPRRCPKPMAGSPLIRVVHPTEYCTNGRLVDAVEIYQQDACPSPLDPGDEGCAAGLEGVAITRNRPHDP